MPPPTTPRGLGPKSPRADAARRLVSQRLADVRHAQEKLGRTLAPDPVHDLRVATRRLRAALQVFRSLGTSRTLERQVKQLQDALGQVRDIHVQTEWLTQRAREQKKPSRREGSEALRSKLHSHLGSREQHLRRALEHWTTHTAPALEAATERLHGPGRYGNKQDRKVLLQRLRRLQRSMKHYERSPHPLLAHQVRKEVKKLRYEAELFHPARPEELDWLLEALEPLQEGLGNLHDADVRMELLAGFISSGSGPQRKAARKLLEEVARQRAEHASEVDHALRRWHARKSFRRLRGLLE